MADGDYEKVVDLAEKRKEKEEKEQEEAREKALKSILEEASKLDW